jgi:signal transduction histidine kinase
MSGVQLLAVRRLEELDQLKNEFLATVTHELRTPLASIIGAGQTLGRRMDVLPPEVARDLIGIVEAQGVRMSKMVEELLRTAEISSRRFSLDLSPVDLTEMIKSVVEAVQLTSDRHRVELEVADPATVDGDRAALERVFTNLVENAIKYSPAGGGVGVRVSCQGSVVLARVTDHGTGIPPDRVAEIFEPFRRAAPGKFGGGLGLGLFIARSIVESHGGSIEVHSAVGEGSTFSVTLPVHAPGTANGVTGIKVPKVEEASETPGPV